ncbi:MAG: DUF456 domain-containing protein [Acidaminococcaceae bacterium]
MEVWFGTFAMYLVILFCLGLTVLDLGGNLWLMLAATGYAMLENFAHYNETFLLYLLLIFVAGELWEFAIGFLGVKRAKVSWLTVLLIGLGSIVGALLGTLVLPVLGSVVGGAVGAFVTAFTVEYLKNQNQDDALQLAWLAFRAQFLAVLGKLVAGVVMAVMMMYQLIF